MGINKFFRFNIFLISFSIGILYVYTFQPKKRIIYKFPNPNNVNDTIYTDKNKQCYKYKVKEEQCTNNAKDQPLVEDFKK